MVPRAALEQHLAQARFSDLVVAGAKRAWRRMRGRTWEIAWREDVGPDVGKVVAAGQAAAAARSAQYVTEVLSELDIRTDADSTMLSTAFAGVTGEGYDVDSLAYGSVIAAAKAQYSPEMAGLAPDQLEQAALDEAETYLQQVVESIMADTARAAETVALAQRPWVDGYVRMIEPGACSRCAVLAGKFYLWNDGFQRHPRCRCVHVPYAENVIGDERTEPSAYFDSLSPAEQDRIFTKAGAEAVRLGADVTQVVNARRGMSTAQQNPGGWIAKGRLVPTDVFGRPTYITTEGVTKRGSARRAMGARPVRLMPESILALAKDRDDALRLLALYGYIT